MVITESQRWFAFALLLLAGWLVYLLAPILTPFLIAAFLAYIGDPLVDRLEDRGWSRTVAVAVVFLVMTFIAAILVLAVAPVLQRQIVQLAQVLPQYIDAVIKYFEPWFTELATAEGQKLDAVTVSGWLTGHWDTASGVVSNLLGYATRSGGVLAAWLANLLLIPIVTFYLLRDWDEFIAGISHLLPRDLEPEIAHIARDADLRLSAFLRGQLLVMFVLGAVYSIGLWLAGVKFALLIGMLAGIVSFVPYLGFIVGIVVASIAVLMQTHDPVQLIPVAAVFGVGQVIEGMFLTPLLVGDKIGLHPVAVIFAVLAGGQLFGFLGVLVALPVAAVLAVIVRDLHRRYIDSAIYKPKEPKLAKLQEPED
ncbi:MAG: AI-2E family transporter [Thiotrichales bacterium]